VIALTAAMGVVALRGSAGALGSVFGGKGGGPNVPDIPDNLGKNVGTLGGGLKAAGIGSAKIALGGVAIGAAIAAIGAGIAGASWLMGKALPTFAEGMEAFEDIDGEKLVSAAKGMGAVSVAMVAMGAASAAAGIGTLLGTIFSVGQQSPIEKLKEFQKETLDVGVIENNANAIVAYSNAMAKMKESSGSALGAISGGIAQGINGLLGRSDVPWDKLKAFGEQRIPADGIKNNAEAVVAYSEAMSKLKVTEGLGAMVGAATNAIARAFGGEVQMPWDKMIEFGNVTLPNEDKIKTNADTLKAFGEAVDAMPQIQGNRQGGFFGVVAGLFAGDVKMPWDQLIEFGNITIPPEAKTNIPANAEALKLFGEAISAMPEIKGIDAGGWFSGEIKMPWDSLQDFAGVTLPPNATEQITTNGIALKLFGEALKEIPEIQGVDTGRWFSSTKMPWELLDDFAKLRVDKNKIQSNKEMMDVVTSIFTQSPELTFSFSEESSANLNRLTKSLRDFQRLNSRDIMSNARAIREASQAISGSESALSQIDSAVSVSNRRGRQRENQNSSLPNPMQLITGVRTSSQSAPVPFPTPDQVTTQAIPTTARFETTDFTQLDTAIPTTARFETTDIEQLLNIAIPTTARFETADYTQLDTAIPTTARFEQVSIDDIIRKNDTTDITNLLSLNLDKLINTNLVLPRNIEVIATVPTPEQVTTQAMPEQQATATPAPQIAQNNVENNTARGLEEMTYTLVSKLDRVIDLLDNGNDTQERLYRATV